MVLPFLFKGLLLGFSIAAPVGPIGLLCVRRTLAEGRSSGLVSGLGAATADAFYGSVAAFGLSSISGLLLNYQRPIRIAGSLFLFYVAAKIFFSSQAERSADTAADTSLWQSYASTVFLTLTNPATILAFSAVFVGLGILNDARHVTSAGSMVLGVFLGSTLWWAILSTAVAHFGGVFEARLTWVNRASAVLLASIGRWSLISTVKR